MGIGIALGLLFTGCRTKMVQDNSPINHFQVIGSHNSYKQAIEPALLDSLKKKYPQWINGLEYAHISLTDQLNLGLRNLELDVYADPEGGKYAHPQGLVWAPNQTPYNQDSVMNKPGFKIFHMPDIDYRTSAATLAIALSQLKAWSNAHPRHFPVFITLEAKNFAGDQATGKLTAKQEETMAAGFDRLDSVLLTGLGASKIMTPDDVRGKAESLNQAVLTTGWPALKDARGKFMFILDDHGVKRDCYIKGHSSLKGRVLFADAVPGTPESAALLRNDPHDPQIPGLVKQGYFIRTRADANTTEARNNDYSRFKAACQSGAQIITTDYYQPSTFFNSSYHIAFKDDSYRRVNPLWK